MSEIEAYQKIADIAHFARMVLLACGSTPRLEALILEIRKTAMEQLLESVKLVPLQHVNDLSDGTPFDPYDY